KETFRTDEKGGTIPKQARFQCREATCGLSQEIVVSIKKTGKSGPVAGLMIEGYCPSCKKEGRPEKFFNITDHKQLSAAHREWEATSRSKLNGYWPTDSIPPGYMSPVQNDLPAHGMPRWADLYNPRQLLVNSLLLKAISTASEYRQEERDFVLGAYQQ